MTLAHLEALALAATPVAPGPWRCEHVHHMQHDIYDADGEEIAGHWHRVVSDFAAAAHPQAVLALVAVARAARESRDDHRDECSCALCHALAALKEVMR